MNTSSKSAYWLLVATSLGGSMAGAAACSKEVNISASGSVPDDADGGAGEGTTDASVSGSDGGAETDSGPKAPDATGKTLWVLPFAANTASTIATDGQGNAYVTGDFSGTVSFGNKQLTASGPADVFVVKIDPMGDVLWATRFGGTGTDRAFALAASPTGAEVYIAGSFDSPSLAVGNDTLTSSNGATGFVAKLDVSALTAPTPVWAKRIVNTGTSGTPHVSCSSLAVTTNKLGLTCVFNGTSLVYDGAISVVNNDQSGTPNSAQRLDGAVFGINPSDGAASWGNGFGTADLSGMSEGIRSIAAEPNGGFLIAGTMTGATIKSTIGGVNLPRVGTKSNAFYARVDASSGTPTWTKVYGDPSGTGAVSATAVGVDPAGAFALFGGGVQATADLGTTVTSNGPDDAFVLAIASASRATTWAKQAGGGGAAGATAREQTVSLASDPWSEVIAIGTTGAPSAKVDGTAITDPPPSTYNTGMFVGKWAPSGILLWAKGYGTNNTNDAIVPASVATTSTGEIRVAGAFQGTVTLDGVNALTSPSGGTVPQAFVMGVAP